MALPHVCMQIKGSHAGTSRGLCVRLGDGLAYKGESVPALVELQLQHGGSTNMFGGLRSHGYSDATSDRSALR